MGVAENRGGHFRGIPFYLGYDRGTRNFRTLPYMDRLKQSVATVPTTLNPKPENPKL